MEERGSPHGIRETDRQEGDGTNHVLTGNAFSDDLFLSTSPHLPIMLPYYESIKGFMN